MNKWRDLRYLQHGNRRQQRAYVLLQELAVATVLHPYDPMLAGTIPLDIDLPASDLDIICAVPATEREQFKTLLQTQYGQWPAFRLAHSVIGGRESMVCTFRCAEQELEVFGQALPVERQNAFRHLVVEDAVLRAGGAEWRAAVRALKQRGLKTEPAFAALLQLPGNPYEALLELENLPEAALRAWLAQCPPPQETLRLLAAAAAQ